MRSTAAVLGSPISHSLSPVIHNRAYQILEVPGEYIAVEVGEENFLSWIKSALSESNQWFGFSLTMPLKELVISKQLEGLVEVDPLAKSIASANTLYLKEGKWKATSTDVMGFTYLLDGKNPQRVAIFGAGGTTRAALAALAALPAANEIKVDIFRRDNKRDALIRDAKFPLQLELRGWEEISDFTEVDLLINTVPHSGVVRISNDLPESPMLIDAIYSPWPPALTELQRTRGGEAITGLELLCAQAVPQVALMTGKSFDSSWLYRLLLEELQQRNFV